MKSFVNSPCSSILILHNNNIIKCFLIFVVFLLVGAIMLVNTNNNNINNNSITSEKQSVSPPSPLQVQTEKITSVFQDDNIDPETTTTSTVAPSSTTTSSTAVSSTTTSITVTPTTTSTSTTMATTIPPPPVLTHSPITAFNEINSSSSSSVDLVSLCTPCRSLPLHQSSPAISDFTKLFATDEKMPWDTVTPLVLDNFKRMVIGDPGALAEYEKNANNFLPPCSLQNPKKLNLFTLSNEEKLNKMSMSDLLRLFRNATVGELFSVECIPVYCLLALLHTKNCFPEKESFQGCVLRIGIDNTEAVIPDRCIQSGFWRSFKEHSLVPAEKKYLETMADSLRNKSGQVFTTDQVMHLLMEERNVGWKKLKRGVIPHSTCKSTPEEIQEFVPPEKRFPTNYGESLYCPATNVLIHQIGFAIPRVSIVDKVSRTKAFDFMPVMPGAHLERNREYKAGLRDEAVFRELYASSYFSFTNFRGGVDCFRHLEILGSGSIPYFPEIETVAKHTVGYLPKALLKKILTLPGLEHIGPVPDRAQLNLNTHEFYQPIHPIHIHFKKRGWINTAKFDVAEYYRIADALLEYTKKYLTCGSMVASILKRLGEKAEKARNVLVVSRFTYDYLHQMVHVGLSELGIAFTVVGEDSSKWSYRLNECSPLSEMTESKRGEVLAKLPVLYGNGLGVPLRAFNGNHNIKFETKRDSEALKAEILVKKFDVVLYTYIFPGMWNTTAYLDEVKRIYGRNEIAFLDHDDANFAGPVEYAQLHKMGTVFARELDERRSCR